MLQTIEGGVKLERKFPSSSSTPISSLKGRELGLGKRGMRFRPRQLCSTLSHSKVMGYIHTQCVKMQGEDVFDGSQSVVDVSMSPGGGSYLAVGRTRPTIDVLDPTSYKMMWNCRGHSDMVTHLEWIPSTEEGDGIPVLASASTDGTIRLWRREKLISVLDYTKDWIRHFSVSSASGKVLSGDISGRIMMYDLTEGKVCSTYEDATNVASYESSLNSVNGTDFNTDGDFIFAVAYRDGIGRIYDTRTSPSKAVISFRGHDGKMNSAIFSQCGQRIVTGGRDHFIRLWDLRRLPRQSGSGRTDFSSAIQVYSSHKNASYNIPCCFLDGDQFIFTGSEDAHAFIYDTETAEVVRKFKHPGKVVHAVWGSNSSHSSTLLTSTVDSSSLFVWEPQFTSGRKEVMVECERSDSESRRTDDGMFDVMETVLRAHGDRLLEMCHRFGQSHIVNLSELLDRVREVGTPSEVDEAQELMRRIELECIRTLLSRLGGSLGGEHEEWQSGVINLLSSLHGHLHEDGDEDSEGEEDHDDYDLD